MAAPGREAIASHQHPTASTFVREVLKLLPLSLLPLAPLFFAVALLTLLCRHGSSSSFLHFVPIVDTLVVVGSGLEGGKRLFTDVAL